MKNKIISFFLAIASLLVFFEYRLFSTDFLVPNVLWVFPFYCWFLLSALYFKKVFGKEVKIKQKIIVIICNAVLFIVFMYGGFEFWKLNRGNVLSIAQDSFQLNIKNIWFWVVYQSYLMLFFFSGFKALVTIDQK